MDEKEKKKFLSVSAGKAEVVKTADETQEHQITFVASSANPDRAKEVVEIGTFKLPLKGGGFVRAAELGSTPNVELDIPFLANHDGWDIDSVLGSVRSASYDGERKELVFTVGISARDKAQEMFQLVKEGHLDNAFSIGWRGGAYNPDTKTYTEGEMLEVSLVTRGCNYDARVINAKGVAAEATKADEPIEPTEEQEQAQPDHNAPDEAEHASDEAELTNVETEKSAETDKEKIMDGKENTQTEVAKTQVVDAPSQKSNVTIATKNYLDTPEAMADLTKHIHENYGKSAEAVAASWKAHLATKGVEGSEILPTTLSQAFFNTFERKDGVLAKFRSIKTLNMGAAYAFSTEDKASGHTKGEKKGYITPKTIRRDWKHRIAYAKMSLDLQDLLDDTTGELTKMRAEMLAERLYTRILEAFVTEDVLAKPTSGSDTRMFDGVRGVFSFRADLDRSKKTGTGADADDVVYAKAVARVIANETTDNTYDKIVKVLRAIKGAGDKAIFVPEGTMTGLMLAKDNDGRYLFPAGSDTESLLKATVVEMESMDGIGYDVIGVNCSNILYANGADMLRAAFDHDYNQDVLLHEKPVAGTAQGWRSIAGYATATTSKPTGGQQE